MTRRIALLALFALAACEGSKKKVVESSAHAAPAPEPTSPPAATPVAPPPAPDAMEARRGRERPKLRLSLRSTPTGATAAMDGRPLGETPLVVEVDADGKVHEFTFVLSEHAIERYRFPPVQDGVIHAQMRRLTGPLDAGVPY